MNKKIILFILMQSTELLLIILLFLKNPRVNTYNFSDTFNRTVEVKIVDNFGNEGYASGFKIKDGILTNRHVVMSNEELYPYIFYRNANSTDFLEVRKDQIIVDEFNDIALIKLSFDDYFSFETSFKIGDKCFTIGNPNGNGLGLSVGHISTINTVENINGTFIRLDINVNKGNSGGPVFNEKGKAIGMISFRLIDDNGNQLDGMAYAIPTTIIEDFIRRKNC